MKFLRVVTGDQRVTICRVCRGPVVLSKLEARGAYGLDGQARVRGSIWRTEPHDCRPLTAGPGPGVGSPSGDGA